MTQKPKKGVHDQAPDPDFDKRVRQLCARLDVPFDAPEISRWALIGIKLAVDEPEFTPRKRGGKPKGGHYPFDQKVLDVIENVAISRQVDFKKVFQAALKNPSIRERLGDNVDRTTHRKRLKRQYIERVKNAPPTLANILLKSYRDKILSKLGWDK